MPYLDILLFAIVAFVLVTRLNKILGQDSNDEDRANIERTWAHTFKEKEERQKQKAIDNKDDAQRDKTPSDKTTEQAFAEDMSENISGSVDSGFRDIVGADASFNPAQFLNGSKKAFEMVLQAFVDGDKDTLQNLLDNKLYTKFASVIDIRTAEGHKAQNDLIGIEDVEPLSAKLEGKIAIVEVKFTSQQINVTYDENDEIVDGHPQAIDTIVDVWTFERDVKSKAPNWVLTHTRTVDA